MLDGYIKVFLCAHAVSRLQVSICGCSAWARVCARGWGTCKGLVVGLVLSAARGTLTSWIRRRGGNTCFFMEKEKIQNLHDPLLAHAFFCRRISPRTSLVKCACSCPCSWQSQHSCMDLCRSGEHVPGAEGCATVVAFHARVTYTHAPETLAAAAPQTSPSITNRSSACTMLNLIPLQTATVRMRVCERELSHAQLSH